jgi:uncharacterized protein YkwD
VIALGTGASPASADQRTFDIRLTLHMPETVGDRIKFEVAMTALVYAPPALTVNVVLIDPSGKEVFRERITTSGTLTMSYTWGPPQLNGQYTARVFDILWGTETLATEVRTTTDKALTLPGLAVPAPTALQLLDLRSDPRVPEVDSPAQVMVQVMNMGATAVDDDMGVMITWPGAAPELLGQVHFAAVKPGEQRTSSFAWTPSRPVYGARLGIKLGGSETFYEWQLTPSEVPVQPAAARDLGRDSVRVLELTNAEREAAGLLPLAFSPELTTAAQEYSGVLALDTCFDHTCGAVPKIRDRVGLAGYTGWIAIAENIAAGNATPESVVAGWMDSPVQRANILSPEYTELGVGVVDGGRLGTYWTQAFGTRLAPP